MNTIVLYVYSWTYVEEQRVIQLDLMAKCLRESLKNSKQQVVLEKLIYLHNEDKHVH